MYLPMTQDLSPLPVPTDDAPDAAASARMVERAEAAAAFLKALSHEGRLMILCHLTEGEKSVTELEQLLQTRQAAVSQQLARLRLDGMVRARREGKTIWYSIADPKVGRAVSLMYEMFCQPGH